MPIQYKEGIVKSRLKNLAALMGDVEIDKMTVNQPFGEFTKDHAEFYRMYLRDALGYKTTFSDWVLKSMENSDPLKLKKNMYYQTSDHEMIKKLDRVLKFFGGDKLPFNLPTNDQARAEAASYENESSIQRTVTIPLEEYDKLKEEQHYITDPNMIAIVDKIGELIRALRKNIRMKV